MQKTIFIAIAFGTSVRDILRNDSFLYLKSNQNNHIVVFAQDIGENFKNEFGGGNISFETLIPYKPTLIERVIMHFHKAILRDRCKTIDLGNTSGNTSTIDKFTPLARLLLSLLGAKRMDKFIEVCYRIFTSPKLYQDHFAKYQPDLVIVTRVLNYSMDYQMLRRAASLNVPVVALVSSWDNLTSKGFFPFGIRSLVVWNHVMKKEAIDLFNFNEDNIEVVGIPRFDLMFRKEGFGEKVNFFERCNLNPTKRLITYCTGSNTTGITLHDRKSPEPLIVEYIADAIDSGEIPEAQMIVRLHPQADVEAYNRLSNRDSVVIQIPGTKSAFLDRLFSRSDDIELGESMLYSDVVINFASTISIDAAVFDTPIICPYFDFTGMRPFKVSMRRLYHFDHYRKLLETGGICLSDTKESLIRDINEHLKNSQLLHEGRMRIIEQQCVYADGLSGKRIANHIEDILSQLD